MINNSNIREYLLLSLGVSLSFFTIKLYEQLSNAYDERWDMAFFKDPFNLINIFSICFAIIIVLALVFKISKNSNINISNNTVNSSDLNKLERRSIASSEIKIRQELNKKLDGLESIIANRVEDRISQEFTDEFAKNMEGRLSSLSSERVRRVEILEHLADMRQLLRVRFEGAVDEAQRSMSRFSFMAMSVMLCGLGVAGWRAYEAHQDQINTVGSWRQLTAESWQQLAIEAAPWLAFVLLLEFTAILFFRRYTASLTSLRTFNQAVYESEMSIAAMRMTIAYGSEADVVALSDKILHREWTIFDRDAARGRKKEHGTLEEMKSVTSTLKGITTEAKSLVDTVAKSAGKTGGTG